MRQFSAGRRQFALGAAAAATTALISPREAIAQAATPDAKPAPPQPSASSTAIEQQTKAAMAKLSPRAQAEVEMKVAEVFRKYGDKLSDEQKADIRRVMAEGQEGLEKMRAFALDNGDQPAAVFQAYRPEGNR